MFKSSKNRHAAPSEALNRSTADTVEITSYGDGSVVSWAKFDHPIKGSLTTMNAEKMAVALENAITAKDNRTIVEILTKISSIRRMEILQAYKMTFGKDVSLPAYDMLKCDFEKVVRSLVVPLPTFIAKELHKAITGIKIDRDTILEILCGFSNNQIKCITSQYELIYERPGSARWMTLLQDESNPDDLVGTGLNLPGSSGFNLVMGRSLEMDILEMNAQEYFKDFCVALSTAVRSSENAKVNAELVKADAVALYNAGEGRYWWSDDNQKESRAAVELAVWIAVLTQRSHKHLLQVFSAYNDLAKLPIEKAINKQFSGDIRVGFLTLVKCIKDKVAYLAERLHYSMEGIGTDDDTLIRVVVSNANNGFSDIKKAFKKKYKDTLENWITGDTSGDYRTILLSIVGCSQDCDKEPDNRKQKLT